VREDFLFRVGESGLASLDAHSCSVTPPASKLAGDPDYRMNGARFYRGAAWSGACGLAEEVAGRAEGDGGEDRQDAEEDNPEQGGVGVGGGAGVGGRVEGGVEVLGL